MSMFMNKLYKGFMYFLSFIMTCIVAYLLGLMTCMIITSSVMLIGAYFCETMFNYIVQNYSLILLLSAFVPMVVYLILIWKDVPRMFK